MGILGICSFTHVYYRLYSFYQQCVRRRDIKSRYDLALQPTLAILWANQKITKISINSLCWKFLPYNKVKTKTVSFQFSWGWGFEAFNCLLCAFHFSHWSMYRGAESDSYRLSKSDWSVLRTFWRKEGSGLQVIHFIHVLLVNVLSDASHQHVAQSILCDETVHESLRLNEYLERENKECDKLWE